MMNGKENLITDLFVVKHHCDSEKDRAIIQDVMDWISRDIESMTYTSRYPECTKVNSARDYIGKQCVVVTDNCRLPKYSRCKIVQWIDPEIDKKNYYICNIDSEYCCWASSQDLQFL